MGNNPEQVQGEKPVATTGQRTANPDTLDPAMNPTVNLHKTDDEVIEEFIRKHGAIGLDWYVPNFSNTRVGDLIRDRLPIETTRGIILFNCHPLREYFRTTTFKLDFTTG